MSDLRIKTVSLDSIHQDPANARTHSEKNIEAIIGSLKEFGQVEPLIVQKETKKVIGGNGRLEVMRKLGWKKAKIVEVDLDDVKAVALGITLNRTTDLSGFDGDVLGKLLSSINDEIDLESLGWDENDLDSLFDEGKKEGKTGDDDAPDLPKKAKTKEGELWTLGKHRLLCGDATRRQHIARLMDKRFASLFLTDPLYNVNYEGKTKEALKIENDKMTDEEFRHFLKTAFKLAADHLAPGCSFYIWHADLEGYAFRGACNDSGLRIRQCLIWNKNNMVMGRQDYHWKHEPCLYGWKDGAAHNWFADRRQATIMEFDRPSRNAEHPTMKPVEMLCSQIHNSSKKDDIVLDTFGGSGSTLIACEKLGRQCYMLEIDPRYMDVILQRWAEFSGEDPIREDGTTWSSLQE